MTLCLSSVVMVTLKHNAG